MAASQPAHVFLNLFYCIVSFFLARHLTHGAGLRIDHAIWSLTGKTIKVGRLPFEDLEILLRLVVSYLRI